MHCRACVSVSLWYSREVKRKNTMNAISMNQKEMALYLEILIAGATEVRIEKGAYEFRVHYRLDGAICSRAIYGGTLTNPQKLA